MKIFKTVLCIMLAAAAALSAGCAGFGPADPDHQAAQFTEGAQESADPTEAAGESGQASPAVTEQTASAEPTAEPTKAPTQAPTAEPTPEPTATPPVDPNPGLPYYLYVEKGSFTITIYGKDENFNYTKVVRQYRIGHGDAKTPVGKFTLGSTRHRWYTFRLGGSVQYATAYWGNLYIHSPLYGSENPWNLWPKYYNGEYGIGTAHTGGCLRMVTEAAKFIYENCPPGTVLEIVNGSPRGTTSPDVPPMVVYGYDPTDVEANNGH